MTVITKFEIPTLSNPSAAELRQWRGQFHASLLSIPDYKLLYDATYAALPGAVVPIPYPAGVPGQHMRASEGILYAAVYGVMRDQEVYNNKFPDNGSIALKEWCNRKSEILGLCPNQLPAPAHNGAMVYALTNLLPSTFDLVCSTARTDAIGWRAIQARLVDFDKANPKAKRESNLAMNARIVALEKAAANPIPNPVAPAALPPAADVHSHYNNADTGGYQFQGYCRKCNAWGHKAVDCWSKKQDKGKGGKKGVKKGDNKKGKGKGKGGKKGKGRKY